MVAMTTLFGCRPLSAFLASLTLLAAMPHISVAGDPEIVEATLAQLSYFLDGGNVDIPYSDWGRLTLKYIGEEDMLYLNVNVQDKWVIENEPVLSNDGVGVEQENVFHFALDTTPGTQVIFLAGARVTLTTYPLLSIPIALTVAVPISQATIAYFSGFKETFLPNPGSAKEVPKNWGKPASPAKHVNTGIKNPPQEDYECEPAAYTNSLKWLNGVCKLDIPKEKLTKDHLKWVTKWAEDGTWSPPTKVKKVTVPGEPKPIIVAKKKDGTKVAQRMDGTDVPVPEHKPGDEDFKEVWEHKRDEFAQWVVTERINLPGADRIGKLLDKNCDVEILSDSHVGVVVGWIKVKGGYKIDVLHDEKQGDPEGQVKERVCLGKDGKITGWNEDLHFFVCECGRKRGGAKGDPHIMTWGGTWFDYHGECDLVLLHTPSFEPGMDLSIHVRTTIRYQYSYIETAVIKLGDDVLQVSGYGGYALNGVDSADLDNAGAKLGGYSIFHSNPNEKEHTFEILINSDEKITVRTFKDLVSVLVDDYSSSGRYDDSVGIMGSYGSGARLGRNGTLFLEDDANEFGQEWQVHSDEPMLFSTARAPQYPNKCVLPSKEAAMERRGLGEGGVSQADAEAACAHLENAVSQESCIYDVLAIGDLDIAKAGIY